MDNMTMELLKKSETLEYDISACIEQLLQFAKSHGILHVDDINYARNALLFALRMDDTDLSARMAQPPAAETATSYLRYLCQYAVEKGVIEASPFDREQFMAHLMNLLTPLPSQVIERFLQIHSADGCEAATDWFYAFCQANDSIRVDEIAKNIAFLGTSPYGKLEITINLSKPEKDPAEIAKLLTLPPSGYPACMLCKENEGYAGRLGYPSHENLRTIPVSVLQEPWRFQFSPYAYYAEHCIVLSDRHTPMRINRRTLSLLIAFVEQFPHYFFGSNADLPIVGGSILNHDHFQGGRHIFPMDHAEAYASFRHPSAPDIDAQLVRWPMTCIRLIAEDAQRLIDLADTLRIAWHSYSDPERGILHQSNGEQHNTITPIARRLEDGRYLMHLVLRNNRKTPEHPSGLFHPHAELHHIKRENIGLIEVMGLFILPGRLQSELLALEDLMTGKRLLGHIDPTDDLFKHARWAGEMIQTYGSLHSNEEARAILQYELTQKCISVLEDAGVYKLTPDGIEGVQAFMSAAGFE